MASAALVFDGEYVAAAGDAIRNSRERAYCSMFLIDPVDPSGRVDQLLDALGDAAWRGVDTRVVIAGAREIVDMVLLSASALSVLNSLSVPCRWLTSMPERGSHAKILVADNTCFVGSHNWTSGAMSGKQRQESLVVVSPTAATILSATVLEQWNRAGGQP
jgi:phosphatidylserine/phosphatidylglycerophosphate/cardiolipin synthase-like enzyme